MALRSCFPLQERTILPLVIQDCQELLPFPSGHFILQIRHSSSSLALARGEGDTSELRQDEHQVADLAKVIAWIWEFCHLDSPSTAG